MADFVLGRLKFVWKGDWATSTAFIVDDVVKYGGNTFVCKFNHTSASTFEADLTASPVRWEKMVSGQDYKGDYANSTYYKVDDVVKYGASLWICTGAHTSSTTLNETKFNIYVPGLEFEDTWSSSTQYQSGDIVNYGGYTYLAQSQNLNVVPTDASSEWEALTTGFKLQGTYSASTAYKTGDVVKYGGNTYVCKADGLTAGSNLPTSTSHFDLLVEGITLKGVWNVNTAYKVSESVLYLNSSYLAVIDNNGQTPVVGGDSGYWKLFTQGDPSGILTTQGDLIIRDATGATRLGIGRAGDRLVVSANGNQLEYQTPTASNEIYVAPSGADTNPGTESLPYKTLKKAASVAQTNGISQISGVAGGTGGTPNTYRNVAVSGGSSSGTTVDVVTDGSSIALVTIVSNGTGWSEGNTATIAGSTIGGATDVTFSVETVQNGDTIRLQGGTYEEQFPIIIPNGTTVFGDSLRGTRLEPAAGSSTSVATVDTFGATDSSRTTGTYTNIATTSAGSGTGLKVTVVVGGGGAITSVAVTYGGANYADNEVITIADSLLGNGGGANLTAQVATLHDNNACSMLLVNNSTYISFMTFQGMTTGASVVSLDPSGAITTASPYIHNCTSVNVGTTGMLIDGFAQSTGNKSMVANDFTQINSDGTGVLATNGGRAELVSVFTYYCDKGFHATTGGTLRALNCSNAYGEYGAHADGVTSTEVPGEVQLRGSQLKYVKLSGNIASAAPAAGDAMTGATSGATATILGHVASTFKLKFEGLSGTFLPNETVNVTGSSSYNFVTTKAVLDLVDTATKTITAVTSANPAVVTSNGHGLQNGTKIVISGVVGMTQVNTNTYYVQNTATNTFSLSSSDDPTVNTNVDSSAFTAYGSAGTITPKLVVTGQSGYLFHVDSTSTFLGTAGALGVGQNFQFAGDSQFYRVTASTEEVTGSKQALVAITPERTAPVPDNTEADVTKLFSNIRLTGHDFLSIGTGSFADTNYPNSVGATQPYDASRETVESNGGRVYYTSTDHLGNFRVGSQFKIDQATGTATLNADAFDLSGLTELQLGSIGAQIGATINEFSTDGTLSGNSDTAVPTEQAVKTYVDTNGFSTGKGIAMAIVFG